MVLRRRVALDRRTGAFGRGEEVGVDGIEVAHDDVDLDTEPGGLLETRIGRDHRRGRWEQPPEPLVDGVAACEHEHASTPASSPCMALPPPELPGAGSRGR